MQSSLNKRILDKLKEKNITQAQLAELLGVHRNTINDWIRGRMEPGLKKAFHLAKILNVSIDWLITGIEKQPELYTIYRVGEKEGEYKVKAQDREIAQIIELYLSLTPESKKIFMELLKNLK